MKKIVFTGVSVGLAMLFISLASNWLLNIIFPQLQIEYQNSNIFRPWSDPLMSLVFVEPILVGILLAYFWNKTKTLFKGSLLKKGLKFALLYWMITLPGMLMSYASFPLSGAMIISWTLTILIESIAAGILFARLNI